MQSGSILPLSGQVLHPPGKYLLPAHSSAHPVGLTAPEQLQSGHPAVRSKLHPVSPGTQPHSAVLLTPPPGFQAGQCPVPALSAVPSDSPFVPAAKPSVHLMPLPDFAVFPTLQSAWSDRLSAVPDRHWLPAIPLHTAASSPPMSVKNPPAAVWLP